MYVHMKIKKVNHHSCNQNSIMYKFTIKEWNFWIIIMSNCFSIKFKKGFSKFILRKIFFFSIIPFASAGIFDIDKGYESTETVIDQGLYIILPIFYYFLASVKPQDRKILLPILDDILYNAVTWLIPLIVSLVYDDLLFIKVFSFVNMFAHLICAGFSYYHIIFRDKATIKDVEGGKGVKSVLVPFFIIFFPIMVIPEFWIYYIYKNYALDSIIIVFIILFILLVLFNFILWYIILLIARILSFLIYTCFIKMFTFSIFFFVL